MKKIRVRCIDAGSGGRIQNGKEYVVLTEVDDRYVLEGLDGLEFFKTRFEIVDEDVATPTPVEPTQTQIATPDTVETPFDFDAYYGLKR